MNSVTHTLFKTISGGICAPKGFRAGAIEVPIRKPKKDLALIVSEVPATVAGVFTLNRAAAAPVLICKHQLKNSEVCSAILVNSGNANACTGMRGMNDAQTLIAEVATTLGIPLSEVLISSTGVIGQFLPLEKIIAAIPSLVQVLNHEGSHAAAEAIMTTDLTQKEIAVEFLIDSQTVKLGAIAKGSGMIAPNMATMLSFVTTDAVISKPLLQQALNSATKKSFNRISVDGDESTNDMVLAMANGLAGHNPIEENTEAFKAFSAALEFVLIELAKMIARDGEGATKFVEINITGARTENDAEKLARSVANSNLVKTAMHGEDANWGRIMAALGYAGVDFTPEQVEISFGEVKVLSKNFEIVLDEAKAKAELSKPDITINIDLNLGNAEATFWTCDLSAKYVEINGNYRS
jgi:glutamate N-acetyltransferase / amino-acid N-acetyltransferase